MLTGLYNSVSAMNAAAVRQDVIASNLAHSDIPGFKRALVSFESMQSEAERGYDAFRPQTSVKTDFAQGIMEQTGRALDLAIAGDGFFAIEGPDGPLLSRNGVLTRNESGQLVTASGYALADSPTIPVEVATSDISIGSDGTVSAAGTIIGRIELVTIDDPSQLLRVGTTMFQAPQGVQTQAAEGEIRQGVRERPNMSTVVEMVQMLSGIRHNEANQKAMEAISDAIQKHTTSGGR